MSQEEYVEFRKRFASRLAFWLWHCIINALPSYLIAVIYLGLWEYPIAHVAMGCAVLTFILGYSVVTSLPGPLARKDSLFSRALNVALGIRLVISVATSLVIPFGPLMLLSPDFWCGRLAAFLVSEAYGVLGLDGVLVDRSFDSDLSGVLPGFMEIYLTTLLEGLFLSFLLFILSFIAIIILQARDKRRMFCKGRL
jgi:hypothetical protein